MSPEQIVDKTLSDFATVFAAFVIVHGAAIISAVVTVWKWTVREAVEKQIIKHKVEVLENAIENVRAYQGGVNDKLVRDLNAAFEKLRTPR